jgi:hypothetical protein
MWASFLRLTQLSWSEQTIEEWSRTLGSYYPLGSKRVPKWVLDAYASLDRYVHLDWGVQSKRQLILVRVLVNSGGRMPGRISRPTR